ncbi:MAG TPA: chitobiase/beta-hexosaminidase C-terminal domain-containing protein, partial [Verrucomicrobiota bacterium]|nr:chitobiase/beta-hexosaminidase C-terminal domain-containing protein [Verrucomicrobiota bacterium]
VVVGQFRYQVANPSIDGINMAGFTITNSTFGAELYYTIDGSEPTTNSTHYLGGRISIFNGLTNDVVFKVRGFKEGYHPSSVVMQTFLFKNLKTSSIGINQTFEAAPGSTIVVPVGMNLLSGDRLRSLQFRTEIKPETAAAPVLPTNNFRAMVVTSNDFIQLQVPAVSGKTAVAQTKSYLNGNTTGVAVAYVATNSFFELTETGPVILLAVQIPASAQAGQVYSLSVLEPSGTLDGFQSTVVLSSLAPTTIKVSTDLGYLVGDVSGYPGVTWYNAGRFGNTNLNNSDVNVAFYASMGLRLPYSFSDIFDAMDSYPMDTPSSVGGDGQIRYLDWQVTLDRSLRLNTNNWWRQLTENGRQPIRTQLSNSPDSPAESYDNSGLAWFRQARIVAGVVENAQPGQRVSVPIYLEVQPGFQVAGLQFRTLITPMNGGPEIAQQGDFAPAGGIPTPPWKLNAAANDILQGWALGNFSPTLQNKMLLGHIRFVIPSGAVSGQSYAVQFTGVDGAPNLDTQYDLESIPGCAWVECSAQQPAETMSDEWKRRFFGSLTHPLAQAGADPDDDGVENAREYAGGTNPVSLRIHTGQLLSPTTTPQGVVLRWFGELGKFYLIESSASLQDGDWQSIAGNLQGQGEVIEYVVKTVAGNNRFYRVRTQ